MAKIKHRMLIFIGIVIISLIATIVVLIVNNTINQGIIKKYLITNTLASSPANVKFKTSFDYSSEGANFYGIYSNNELQYLSVNILGEMGRQTYEYSFMDNFIIYICIETYYEQPFYIDPKNNAVREISYKKYSIYNGKMYDVTNNEIEQQVSKEVQESAISKMQDFISTLENGD